MPSPSLRCQAEIDLLAIVEDLTSTLAEYSSLKLHWEWLLKPI